MILSDLKEYLSITLKEFPFLNVFFQKDFEKRWNDYLSGFSTKEALLQADHLNLLLAVVGAGYEIKHDLPLKTLTPLLQTAKKYLSEFSSLLTEKRFLDKFSNPSSNAFAFISTLSELSIAYWLKYGGFTVEFEIPVRKLVAKTGKKLKMDVDIKAVTNIGKVFFIEVYNPWEVHGGGFLKFPDHDVLTDKVARKLGKKFGLSEIADLQVGPTFLAVNTVHVDSLTLEKSLSPSSFQNLLGNSTAMLPASVRGVIYFEDNFAGQFTFHGLFLKEDHS